MKFSWVILVCLMFSLGFVLSEKTGSYSDHLTLSKTTNGVIVIEGKTGSGAYCGDGIIQVIGGEQCDVSDFGGQDCVSLGYDGGTLLCQNNCVFDTTSCYNNEAPNLPNDNPGGSGGSGGSSGSSGSSGGSSVKSSSSDGNCVEMWNCSEWSSCENGMKERTCVDSNNCDTVKNKPFESIECEDTTTDEEKNLLITGGVIGTLGKYGIFGVLVLIAIILGLLVYVKMGKGKGKKKR